MSPPTRAPAGPARPCIGGLAAIGQTDRHQRRRRAAGRRAPARRRHHRAHGGGQERAGVQRAQAGVQGARGRQALPRGGAGSPRPAARAPSTRRSTGTPPHDYKWAVVSGGKPSITHYDTLEAFPAASLVDVRLETGRTHQIRVHFSALRHPCVGDLTYGADPTLSARLGLHRQWLHARELAFLHPPDARRGPVHQPVPGGSRQRAAILRVGRIGTRDATAGMLRRDRSARFSADRAAAARAGRPCWPGRISSAPAGAVGDGHRLGAVGRRSPGDGRPPGRRGESSGATGPPVRVGVPMASRSPSTLPQRPVRSRRLTERHRPPRRPILALVRFCDVRDRRRRCRRCRRRRSAGLHPRAAVAITRRCTTSRPQTLPGESSAIQATRLADHRHRRATSEPRRATTTRHARTRLRSQYLAQSSAEATEAGAYHSLCLRVRRVDGRYPAALATPGRSTRHPGTTRRRR